jgi:hypothetical protein
VASPIPAQPDTPPTAAAQSGEPLDRIVRGWLDAFNSGDRTRITDKHYEQPAGWPFDKNLQTSPENAIRVPVGRIDEALPVPHRAHDNDVDGQNRVDGYSAQHVEIRNPIADVRCRDSIVHSRSPR